MDWAYILLSVFINLVSTSIHVYKQDLVPLAMTKDDIVIHHPVSPIEVLKSCIWLKGQVQVLLNKVGGGGRDGRKESFVVKSED